MAIIFANLLAGLGLFFIGVKLIGSHLKQMAGRKFREWVAWVVRKPWQAGILGVLAGALTQSTNAVTFIVASMNTAGLLTVREAMPLVIWANLGTAALVMVATVNIQLLVLYLLGLVGLAFYFDVDKSNRWRHPAGALLGVSLLFFGLQLIKLGAGPLREMEAVRELLVLAGRFGILLFLAGAVVTFVVQSSGTVSVIAVAMTNAGLLTIDDTILLIYGSGVGSAASLWVMTVNLRGTARQLALLQMGLKCVAAFILLILLVLELKLGWPLMKALVAHLSSNIGLQAAWVFLLYQVVGGLALTLSAGPVYRLLQRWAPPSREEALARPQYLFDQALDDAQTALDLVEREQARLVRCLPAYLSEGDLERAGELAEPIPILLHANRVVAGQIAEFITKLMDRHRDRQALDRMLNLQNRNRLLNDLREGLHELDQLLIQTSAGQNGKQDLECSVTDALHFLLLALADGVVSPSAEDLELLRTLTADRAEVIEKLRHKILTQASYRGYQAQETLYSATSLFERIVWLIRQYSQLLSPH